MLPGLGLSWRLVALDVVGALLAGLGMLGLAGGGGWLPPWLTDKTVAGALFGAGLGMMAYFFVVLMKKIRTAQRKHQRL
ncbi:hypothetical protein [Chitinimonas lacunae]|uniref:AtpZ/AtpI family protein n=1 Tax=Chitinimonas lacunae TaxID=1963018 RepID=A0ABV8MQQ1_9NEIS